MTFASSTWEVGVIALADYRSSIAYVIVRGGDHPPAGTVGWQMRWQEPNTLISDSYI